MGNFVGSVILPGTKSSDLTTQSKQPEIDDEVFLERQGSYRKEKPPHILYVNRINSSVSNDYSAHRNSRRSSILTESTLNRYEQDYWTMKLTELKTYSDWDKQYIMDSLLRDAIILRRPSELDKLIELGANVNCKTFSQFSSDRDQDSQLHYAVRSGDYEVCDKLLQCGAQATIRGSDGRTPIDICDNGKIHQLLSTFADTNKENLFDWQHPNVP